jgi:glycosyltransferase involved in cell wall biosynthesis
VTRVAIVPPVPVPYREPLFAALAARPDIDVRVIYMAASAAGWEQPAGWFGEQRRGYDAVVLRPRQRARRGRTPIVWPQGLERELSAFDAEVVVVSEFGPAALRALAWCARRRRPLVILTEVTADVHRELPRAQRALHRWLARRAAGVVATSTAARDRVVALGVDPGRVEVSLQSADLGPVRAAAAARDGGGATGAPVRLLTVARLVPDKNVGGLLEALAESGLDGGEAELDVCGTGPLEDDLRAAAERLAVPVRFAGWVAPDALPQRYAEADAFVLASTWEPFGVAIREAVAAGLPLICSSVAGAAGDVAVDGENAILFDPHDTGALAGALRRVCREPELRASMAAASSRIDGAHGTDRDVDAFARAVLRAAAARRAG